MADFIYKYLEIPIFDENNSKDMELKRLSDELEKTIKMVMIEIQKNKVMILKEEQLNEKNLQLSRDLEYYKQVEFFHEICIK